MFFLDEMCGACASAGLGNIPNQVVNIIHIVFVAIKIGVPLILIFVGMFDMARAITLQKEDEIKKAQNLLVRKAVAAALVFLMLSLVSTLFSVVGGEGSENIWSCVNALLNGICS